MPLNVSVFAFSLFGLSFVFQGYMFSAFIFLWFLYGFIVPLDVWTRVRILKLTATSTKSWKMRTGIADKVQILLLMLFLAIGSYYVSGIFGNGSCSFICVTSGGLVALFMGMFVVTEFSSVLENQIEFAAKSGTKPNKVVELLAKALGIIYTNLTDSVEDKLNQLNHKDVEHRNS